MLFKNKLLKKTGAGNPVLWQVKQQVEQKTGLAEQGTPPRTREEEYIYDLWKQGLASWGEYRTAVHSCREKRNKQKKLKVQVELALASVSSENTKNICFFKYFNSKKRSKKNIGLILDVDGYITGRPEKKAKAFDVVFFGLSFTSSDRFKATLSS